MNTNAASKHTDEPSSLFEVKSLREQQVSTTPPVKLAPKKVIVIGAGIAGTEAKTHLAQNARIPLEITSIEIEPSRREGGWAFQSFPNTETTNLAARKMYLGRDPDEIFKFLSDPEARKLWPLEFKNLEFDPDQPIPRALMQHYARWRLGRVENEQVAIKNITGEAMRVVLNKDKSVSIELADGRKVTGDRIVMASGSIAVKVPAYMTEHLGNPNFIEDPLTIEGHNRRANIARDARVLILGQGLTGEEQCSVLLKSGHTKLTSLSRGGRRHFRYPEKQENKELSFDRAPDFLMGETPEEITERWENLVDELTDQGYSNEDIFKAIQPHWDSMRALLGGCEKAMRRLFETRRLLATESVGASFEVTSLLDQAEKDGRLSFISGHIQNVIANDDGSFLVQYGESAQGGIVDEANFDVIINAVGRNIIRHPLWEQLLEDGIAHKHASIGIRVNELGQLLNTDNVPSEQIWVIGMARAGDHAGRHGRLGNTAFNVPAIRSHVYDTMDAMLSLLTEEVHQETLELDHLLHREALIDRLGQAKLMPFIRQDQSREEIDNIVNGCAENHFNVLGFMPSNVSDTTLEALKLHPLVASKEITLAATNASWEQTLVLQDTGVNLICCKDDVGQIDPAQLSPDTLLIPIVNDLEQLPRTIEYLAQHELPSVIKIYIPSGDPLSPDALKYLCKQYPAGKFIVFGGVSPENAQAYTESGILAAGMGRLLPDHLLSDSTALNAYLAQMSQTVSNS